MIIYKITNKLNGKIYIGQTVQPLADRWSDHSRPSRGMHPNRSAIGSAIRKYGKENFTIEQIDSAETLEMLNVMEITYIKALNSLAPNGYNMELGGESKLCHEETKEKISATLKGRKIANRWTGGNRSPRTDAQRSALSAKIKGRPNVALHKQVECIETGVIYESVNACAAAHGCNRVTISSLLKSKKKGGKLGTKGFSFRLVAG
jgi:group I intron endonuclease